MTNDRSCHLVRIGSTRTTCRHTAELSCGKVDVRQDEIVVSPGLLAIVDLVVLAEYSEVGTGGLRHVVQVSIVVDEPSAVLSCRVHDTGCGQIALAVYGVDRRG